MASLLRKIVAGPRARHPDVDLDLCYVSETPCIIATSGPSGTYPQRAYRNSLDTFTKFLNNKHGDNWKIWEFRAEGTGYPDSAVEGRVWHFPWPDHHPPPFELVPRIMASMRDWLKPPHQEGMNRNIGQVDASKRVVVVHCKAGKGRSGTASCSYLISEEGWTKEDAIKRFTERRMRPGWGAGVSIPSQLRWLGYVERWKRGGKLYVERKVEVAEIHVWGLRDGVQISVRGFIEEGKVIKVWHTFTDDEREIVRGQIGNFGFSDAVWELMGSNKSSSVSTSKTGTPKNHSAEDLTKNITPPTNTPVTDTDGACESKNEANSTTESNIIINPINTNSASGGESTAPTNSTTPAETAYIGADAVFRPKKPILLNSNDINIDTERRTKGVYTFGVTTSIAHVWFNTFFEGMGPENNGKAADSGVFEIEWDKMDGIKGSSKRGTRAFDKIQVVWKIAEGDEGSVIRQPAVGEEVKQAAPADWKGVKEEDVKPEQSTEEPETSDEEDQGTKTFVDPVAK